MPQLTVPSTSADASRPPTAAEQSRELLTAFDTAVRIAREGKCLSRRGVVIWRGAEILARAFNGPPSGYACDGSDACKSTCGKTAVHAEERAVLLAARSLVGAQMMHVKIVDNYAVASGQPSCWQCSRVILEVGIDFMWLLHENGFKRYAASEFHGLTLAHNGL